MTKARQDLWGSGIGLRQAHSGELLKSRPAAVDWLEIHSETYLAAGGPRLDQIDSIRRDYPLSCHSVGISLGSACGIDEVHLMRLRKLYDRLQPGLISDHLAWSVQGGVYLNDLLPLPYTEESLEIVIGNLDRAQTILRRQLLVENPSTYLKFTQSSLTEEEFLAELVRRTGCGLLLDVNNLFVSSHNQGIDISSYVAALPPEAVKEIHVAGHSAARLAEETVLVDDHGSIVDPRVWDLLFACVAVIGPVPVLVEWDLNLPALDTLAGEAGKAAVILRNAGNAG